MIKDTSSSEPLRNTQKETQEMSTTYQLDQLVRLQGLKNASYNGKLAIVRHFPSAELCCNGRYRVRLMENFNQYIDVKPENIQHACARCHKGGENLLYCGKCRNARYCDANCQRLDWLRHKDECLHCVSSRDASKNPLLLAVGGENFELVCSDFLSYVFLLLQSV